MVGRSYLKKKKKKSLVYPNNSYDSWPDYLNGRRQQPEQWADRRGCSHSWRRTRGLNQFIYWWNGNALVQTIIIVVNGNSVREL